MIAALIKSGKILKGRPQKDHRGLGLRLGALESMMVIKSVTVITISTVQLLNFNFFNGYQQRNY